MKYLNSAVQRKVLPIINLLGVDKEEKVTAMIPVGSFEEDEIFLLRD